MSRLPSLSAIFTTAIVLVTVAVMLTCVPSWTCGYVVGRVAGTAENLTGFPFSKINYNLPANHDEWYVGYSRGLREAPGGE